MAQSGDDAVALGKMVRQRRRAQGAFTQDHAMLHDAMRQIAVLARVHAIQSGADYGNGRQSDNANLLGQGCLQSAFMCGAIHAQGQTRHYRPTHFCKCLAKSACIAGTLWRRVAAAHHGDTRLRLLQALHLPHGVQQDWRIGHLQQHRWIRRIAQRHDTALHGEIA